MTGENFNEFSAIVMNGQPVTTAYIDENHIVAHVDDPATVAEFAVAQVARDGTVLSQTEAFRLEQEDRDLSGK